MVNLNRNEILVIKACKGHFDELLGTNDSYEVAEEVIRVLVYGNNQRVQVDYMIAYVREIILKYKTQRFANYSAGRWELFTDRLLKDAFSRKELSFGVEKKFIEHYLEVHFNELAQLQVVNFYDENIMNLDTELTTAERTRLLGAFQVGYNSFD